MHDDAELPRMRAAGIVRERRGEQEGIGGRRLTNGSLVYKK
jgi:hypothetical protein